MRTPLVLLTIRPEHAAAIYAGTKRAELRKSFPRDGATVVLMYETGERGAVTGAFIVKSASRLPVHEIVREARRLGVPEDRSRAYFGKRSVGWLLEIAKAVKFDAAVYLADLRELNHFFLPPQVFSYLPATEGSTQLLAEELCNAL